MEETRNSHNVFNHLAQFLINYGLNYQRHHIFSILYWQLFLVDHLVVVLFQHTYAYTFQQHAFIYAFF
ncbi:hypothetical protein E8E13_007427 [Curvularia kusanoi]|uniref:Uncharacterized protein n=1 Tax=Curvularia kusanoi TaxID=90978 RepID=A0A9P4WCW1_CURKU|nr:hypothetical protein E8E13_007427 [Curvularia kusanoi]